MTRQTTSLSQKGRHTGECRSSDFKEYYDQFFMILYFYVSCCKNQQNITTPKSHNSTTDKTVSLKPGVHYKLLNKHTYFLNSIQQPYTIVPKAANTRPYRYGIHTTRPARHGEDQPSRNTNIFKCVLGLKRFRCPVFSRPTRRIIASSQNKPLCLVLWIV